MWTWITHMDQTDPENRFTFVYIISLIPITKEQRRQRKTFSNDYQGLTANESKEQEKEAYRNGPRSTRISINADFLG